MIKRDGQEDKSDNDHGSIRELSDATNSEEGSDSESPSNDEES